MRDFHDAKVMAHTLREALKIKSVSLTHSESLELIARVLGFNDWNILSAKLQSEHQPRFNETSKLLSEAVPKQGPDDEGTAEKQQEISLDRTVLDRYAGFYLQLQINAVISVMRDSDRLFVQWNWQRKFPVYAKSEMEFVSKAGKIHIRFMASGTAPAPTLTWQGSGSDMRMERIDAAQASKAERMLADKIKNRSPNPGSEAALRRLIDGIAKGHPNFHEMSDFLSEATRKHLSRMRENHAELGAVQSVVFLGLNRNGADVYTVKHENGAAHWRIGLNPEGLIATAAATPGP